MRLVITEKFIFSVVLALLNSSVSQLLLSCDFRRNKYRRTLKTVTVEVNAGCLGNLALGIRCGPAATSRGAAKVSLDSLCPGLDSNLVHSVTVYVMDVVSGLTV